MGGEDRDVDDREQGEREECREERFPASEQLHLLGQGDVRKGGARARKEVVYVATWHCFEGVVANGGGGGGAIAGRLGGQREGGERTEEVTLACFDRRKRSTSPSSGETQAETARVAFLLKVA